MSVRQKLAGELVEISDQIAEIDRQIETLKNDRNRLSQRRNEITRRLESSDAGSSVEGVDQYDSDKFPWSSTVDKVLKETFRLSEFRPLQRAAINAVLSGEDVLVVMSTGAGKSLCYQLPPFVKNGLALIVSPLLSLAEDQLHQLRKLGISASSLNASTQRQEANDVNKMLTSKDCALRLLYVTPEKLAKSKSFMSRLEKCCEQGKLALIAVDEVHCCSSWGHDFRKDYQFLNVLKRQFKGVPILGLTATATQAVLDDVKSMLGIHGALVLRSTFNRPNLRYEVCEKPTNSDDALDLLAKAITTRFLNQSGIVYCLTRKDSEEVAEELRKRGVSAAHYHADLAPDARTRTHDWWLSGKLQAIVATVAFGMGIDKPDVRFVIHHSMPKSVENYYQESGRAGRDGKPAVCLLFYRFADIFRQSTMVCTERTGLSNLYRMLRYALETRNCRRVVLAEHFEETWDASWCQKGCDICEHATTSTEPVDVTEIAKLATKTIENQANTKKDNATGRVTAAKLVDLLAKELRAQTSKSRLEYIVAKLLLSEHLTEDFHFTPYSILSYMVAGPAWRRKSGEQPIMENLPVERGNDSSNGGNKSKDSTGRKRKLKQQKPSTAAAADGEEREVYEISDDDY